MREKPPLDDGRIIACLKDSYDLAVTHLEFLPLGYDNQAGVYRARASGQSYFIKVKGDGINELALRVPRYLKEQGLEEVVAPIPTLSNSLSAMVDRFTLAVYPFIEGRSGAHVKLSESQWMSFGAALKKLHSVHLPTELLNRLPREDFLPNPKWSATTRQLHTTIANRRYFHPVERQLAAFWERKHDVISTILDRTEHLGTLMQARPAPMALCHSDIHTANLMVDSSGAIFMVDWDQPMLAPIERDLLFVTVGGFISDPREEAWFFEGYGKVAINRLALAYYRYARAVEDMGGFGEHIFLMESGGDAKKESLHYFTLMFEPGNIIDAADRLYDLLFR